ncbi:MAG: histidine phosphatase family protein, partial [Pseudomonadota bacterium]
EVIGFEEYSAEAIMKGAGLQDRDPSLTRREHFRRLRGALLQWAAGEIEGAETWEAFNIRVRAAVTDATRDDGRVLVAASGGSIALVLMQVMDLRPDQWIEFNLQIRNASITRLVFSSARTYVNMFNAIPHLDRPDRKHAETYS